MYTVQSDSNKISLSGFHFYSQCYAKVSYYRDVGLSSRGAIDMHLHIYMYISLSL